MRYATTRSRSAVALALVAVLLGTRAPPAGGDGPAWQPATAFELQQKCASPSWSFYMACQAFLLEISDAAEFCVPEGTSAARLQIEFVRHVRAHPELVGGGADTAARDYLGTAFVCR